MYTVRKVQPYKICFFTFHTFFLLNREGAARDGALSILFIKLKKHLQNYYNVLLYHNRKLHSSLLFIDNYSVSVSILTH